MGHTVRLLLTDAVCFSLCLTLPQKNKPACSLFFPLLRRLDSHMVADPFPKLHLYLLISVCSVSAGGLKSANSILGSFALSFNHPDPGSSGVFVP